MENPNNFLINTDYPLDMIIYYKFYELTTDGSSSQTVTIPHGLGFTPLLFGVWSTTPDFAVSHMLVDDGYNLFSAIYVESDETNVYIQKKEPTPTTGKKRYLKIYGFAPISWTGESEPTAQSNTPLILNTDKQYAPLLAAGMVQPRRLDVQPEVPTPEQTGIYGVIGKNGYKEFSGRSANVSLYYQEPVSPTVMMWKTTSSTDRTAQTSNTFFSATGFALRTAPYADFANAGAAGDGRKALAITVGTTRTGMANYNDIVHFRVYG
jgi:hypothetical protein